MNVRQGDCLDILREFPDSYFDSVVTDPPYALEIKGREWDSFDKQEFQEFCQKWATECLRVIKPGRFLIAFGATRTYHRLACGIEDAGFEIRDSWHWIFGKGFPKSKTSLKPGHEPILLARKPGPMLEAFPGLETCRTNGNSGRVPSNLIFAHSVECVLMGEKKIRANGSLTGNEPPPKKSDCYGDFKYTHAWQPHGNGDGTETVEVWKCDPDCPIAELDRQSNHASRFYFKYQQKASTKERPHIEGIIAHPTVKPLELMRWLIKLVTPIDGVVLDPFAGTGTTGQACKIEGRNFMLIEKETDYVKLIHKRLAQTIQCDETLFDEVV